MDNPDQDESDDVPLQQQRYFGSGVKRRRIEFVAAKGEDRALEPSMTGAEMMNWYYGLFKAGEVAASNAPERNVVDEDESSTANVVDNVRPATTDDPTSRSALTGKTNDQLKDPQCDICFLPIKNGDRAAHDQRIDHIKRTSLSTISSVDRTRKGLVILEKHGFDPDSGQGLGVRSDGLLHPLKAKDNPGRIGLGFGVDDPDDQDSPPKKRKPPILHNTKKLNAKQMQQLDKAEKQRMSELRHEFYGSSETTKFLNGVASGGRGMGKRPKRSKR